MCLRKMFKCLRKFLRTCRVIWNEQNIQYEDVKCWQLKNFVTGLMWAIIKEGDGVQSLLFLKLKCITDYQKCISKITKWPRDLLKILKTHINYFSFISSSLLILFIFKFIPLAFSFCNNHISAYKPLFSSNCSWLQNF